MSDTATISGVPAKPPPWIPGLRIGATLFFVVLTVGMCFVWHVSRGIDEFFASWGFPTHRRSIDVYLYLASVSTISIAVPWYQYLPHRFSLRTMLIVTTLIAFVLGAVMWSLGR